ncbi:MAG: regulatory iron-sulfur-containing complex subunit RicT, partial [Candidatus Komeilibacteria bacterium]
LEIGRVIGIKEIDDQEVRGLGEVSDYIRIANDDDLSQLKKNNVDNDKRLELCRQYVKKNDLQMKLVDCHTSFDGSRMVFAFIADGRIDFRNLVKDLTRKFKKSIRLQQLGVRDEAKATGDCGSCGRGLCCSQHLRELGNVSTEFAKDQQIAHRGSERLSGACGRLKCCLAYEEEHYKESLKKFPEVGSKVKTKEGEGYVININVLSGTYDVRVNDPKKGTIVIKEEIK